MNSRPLPIPDLDSRRLAELVLELARQLHVERVRRLALEQHLADTGQLDAAGLERLLENPDFRRRAEAAADAGVAALVDIMTEPDDPRRPLRGVRAPGDQRR